MVFVIKTRCIIQCSGRALHSFELADRIHTEVAFCGKDKDILNELRAALKTEYYHISVTDDIAGIETAVAAEKCLCHGGKPCNRSVYKK